MWCCAGKRSTGAGLAAGVSLPILTEHAHHVGTLMGDPVAMVTLLPNIPEAALGQSQAGEFIFLLDRSGSMGCPMDSSTGHPLRIDSAKVLPSPVPPSLQGG